MAALAGMLVRPLRHEGGHQAVLLRQRLGEGLEEEGLVAGGGGLIDRDGRLQHAGTGLGMQAFDRHVHALAHVEQLAIEIALHGAAQLEVAEVAGGPVLHVAVVLGAHRVRRLAEHEKLVFERGVDLEAHAGGAIQRAMQQAARADVGRGAFELGQEQQHVLAAGPLLQRQPAAGAGHDAQLGIGIGRVPAGVLGVVVELVVQVPAEHHVAESQPAAQRGQEFVAPDVLAQHDAIDVGQADLDMRERAGLDQPLRVFHRCYP